MLLEAESSFGRLWNSRNAHEAVEVDCKLASLSVLKLLRRAIKKCLPSTAVVLLHQLADVVVEATHVLHAGERPLGDPAQFVDQHTGRELWAVFRTTREESLRYQILTTTCKLTSRESLFNHF